MIPLTTLDILTIVSTIVIAGIGTYLMIILHHVMHMVRVADRFARLVEKFQDAFAIVEKIPTDFIRHMTDHLSFKKKK